jgi:hypothetical protein
MSMRAAPLLLILCCGWPAHGADLKDPTKPPAAAAPSAIRSAPVLPVVSAVFISSFRQVAIFNDQPVRVGDHVGAFRIDEINPNGVRYSAAGHSAFAPLAGRTDGSRLAPKENP